MKRRLAITYAIFLTVLLVAGFIGVFVFAWFATGWRPIIEAIYSFILSFILAPVVHELGHVTFAAIHGMECVYFKAFCFRVALKNGKKRFAVTSPFTPDETQVIPKRGGDMQKRATAYTLGGLIFSGAFLATILIAAVVCTCVGHTRFDLWGLTPYVAYLFLLNLPPFEYHSGKTDTLVYRGIKKGEAAEKNMLAAMEIQGQLYEGKSFAEIDEKFYTDVPQLCEDEPLFAVMTDLRYRYYLEKKDFDRAADNLNRLTQAQEYLPEEEIIKIAAEFTYMHSINGDIERAEETGEFCHEYLIEENLTAKRILMAYMCACGNTISVEHLKEQVDEVAQKERIAGVRKFEKILISRIETV